MRYIFSILLAGISLVSFSQTKDDYVKYIGTRVKVNEGDGKFISFKLKGSHLIYRYKMSLTSPSSSQHWIQEIDLDLSKIEDIVTIEENGYYWPTMIFSGDQAIFYDLDENGVRIKQIALNKYSWGFSKEESVKIKSYLKKLAKMCGARMTNL